MVKRIIVKRAIKLTAQTSVIGLITLLLFELCFRIYIIDFYASTFNPLNSEMEDRNDKPTLMIVGDSFSALQGGYPKVLHDSLSQYRVRNISVPGTSIAEQYLFGRHYIKKEQPDILIFQFYVGNDLLGWRHKLNWKELPFSKNVYWGLSDKIRSLGFLNHRLSNLNTDYEKMDIRIQREIPFSPDHYTLRDKYYFKSEPGLIENTASLKEGRDRDFGEYVKRIQDLFDYASHDTQIFLLIIPHCSQVTEQYKLWTAKLGADFSKQFEPGSASYPLYDRFVEQFKEDKRVRVLNPIVFMEEIERQNNSLYFKNDSHLNSLGQEMIGRYLLNEISNYATTND